MQVNINTMQTTMNIPECMTIHKMQQAMLQNNHLQQLKEQIIRGWPENKDNIAKKSQTILGVTRCYGS